MVNKLKTKTFIKNLSIKKLKDFKHLKNKNIMKMLRTLSRFSIFKIRISIVWLTWKMYLRQ